jgi:hypothetical protein
MANASERLEPIVAAGGRLLRVEREPAAGAAGARVSVRLRLWFDVGVVELYRAGSALEAEPVEPGAARLVLDAAEEEPWWALIGHPLTRVSPREDGSLLVQFRPDDASPRVLVLASEPDGVGVETLV